jgi:hypothetical protein
MTIIKWQVSPYASTPDRREYDKETECFYLYRTGRMNVARRDAKSSSYYRYFDTEQEALNFIRQRNENKAEQKRVDQIKRHAVELLEALEKMLDHFEGSIPLDLFELAESVVAKAKGNAQ